MENVKWLKDCEICNTGLCKQIDEYKEQGMSERAASRKMEQECDELWSADKIYGRYRYYKKGHAGGVGKTHTLSDDEILARAEAIKSKRKVTVKVMHKVRDFLLSSACQSCPEDPSTCRAMRDVFNACNDSAIEEFKDFVGHEGFREMFRNADSY